MRTNLTSWGAALRRAAQAASLAALTALAACGGGSSGDSMFGDGDGNTPVDPTLVEASDLSIVLSAASLPNNGQDRIIATITAVDANRNALANIPVTVSVNAEAVASVSGTKTNDKGEVIALVGTGSDRSNRVVAVTATSGKLKRVASFQITGAKMTARLTPAVVAPGAKGNVEFILVDTNSNPMPGMAIVVQGVDGVETSGTTGLSGQFVYNYVAPATAGEHQLRATSGGFELSTSIMVQPNEDGAVPDATIAVQSATVSANPNVVAANSEGTSNRAELRALFISSNNAPVKNIRARFDLDGDSNSIGGSITSGTGYVYSSAAGIATSAYEPGGRESPTDGVTIRVCWDYRDFPVGTCPNAARTKLTVRDQPLSVSIRTDDKIETDTTGIAYVKRYLVQVNDASGLAKANVIVTPVLDLTDYFKGRLVWAEPYIDVLGNEAADLKWAVPRSGYAASCQNEDINRNGVSEVYASGREDANNNGQLDPYKADVVVSFEGTGRTDERGQLVLRLTYAKELALWSRFELKVTSSVLGSEGKAVYRSVLPAAHDDMTEPLREPPNVRSPYGTQSSPITIVTNSEGQSASLCTNPN